MYKYKVSVVMAVYKVEPFLREAIDSVIDQDIGFDKIQLILVDDGSPDGCGQICDEYAAKYPDNILVIHKENGGVSSARNAGLDRVEGEFVNFLDADDKLERNAVSACCRFLEKHGAETDVVSIPIRFFEARTGDHWLNYKYEAGTRVIDLEKEWQNPQYSLSSAFVKADCLKQLRFDTRLSIGEDLHLMQKLLLPRRTLGVVSETAYCYRKRGGEQSAIQARAKNKSAYLPMLQYIYLDILALYREKYSRIPRFIQNSVLEDLQWHIRRENIPEGVLTEEEKQTYLELLHRILQDIEDEVITGLRDAKSENTMFTYRLKYRDALRRELGQGDICVAVGREPLFKASDTMVRLEFYHNDGKTCTVEGVLNVLPGLLNDCKVLVKAGDRFYETEAGDTRKPVIYLEQEALRFVTFRAEIPLEGENSLPLEFYCESEGIRIPLHRFRYGNYFPVSDKFRGEAYSHGGWLLTRREKGLFLRKATRSAAVKQELIRSCSLLKKGRHKALVSRIMAHIVKRIRRKPLWLISDRASKAGDNGEALFRFLREQHPEIDARFVINGECPDYEAMKKIGPVVKKDSNAHKLLYLVSDCAVSSHCDADTFNPLYRNIDPFRDLLADKKHVFLQHGITKDDLSGWLCRHKKNLKGFVTAARPEYGSILSGSYGYTEQQVWLTGFPRFDRVYRDSARWITIMPTWRKYIMGQPDPHTGLWTMPAGAESSEYIRFYSGLLNHPRLLDAAVTHGYQIKFMPHPTMQSHLELFGHNDRVDCLGTETRYRDIYAKSDLVVTDYSSAVFDFAYLRKPLVYTHFDRDEFFSNGHVYTKGYFDYERDGFGEVEYDLESTVDRIIEYMENGCRMKDEYKARADSFFAFNDQNNCQRVYDKILELTGQDKKNR